MRRVIASMVGRESWGRPRRKPSAMNSGVLPSTSGRFQTLASAPRSASNCTIAGKLPSAAPCIAVWPLLSTSLSPAPRSRSSCTASSASASVPASSRGFAVPRPAAAISGRAVLGIRQEGVRAQLEQDTHERSVRPVGSHQERRRLLRRKSRRRVRRARRALQLLVHVRPPLHELANELKARQASRSDRGRIALVTGIRLPHPAHRMQRSES